MNMVPWCLSIPWVLMIYTLDSTWELTRGHEYLCTMASCSWVLMAHHGYSWLLTSGSECLSVIMSGHEHSWALMSRHNHPWALMGMAPSLGWLRISISWKIMSALTSWMFLRVCDEILINLNPFGVYPTALRAHEKFQDSYISPKKILLIIGFMVLKMTGLNPGF